MANKYRAAVIGCGRIGSEFDEDPKRKYIATHAGAYNRAKNVILAAACDTDRKKLNKCVKRWDIPAGYENYRKMMACEAIDVASVCTSPETHYRIIKDLVNYDSIKAIFCEKPMADNLRDAREIVRLCKKKKVILQIDHQRRFDPLHRELRNFINGEGMGKVQQANFYYTAGVKNTGSHVFDLLRFLFGEAEWIEAFFSRNESHKKEDPNLDGLVKFKSGLLCTFQALDVTKYLIFELNCFFEGGKIVLKNSGFDMDFYATGKSAYFSGYKELHKASHHFKVRYKRNFMVNAVNHLLHCVRKRKKSISSDEDGLRAVELIEKVILSAMNRGKRIYLK